MFDDARLESPERFPGFLSARETTARTTPEFTHEALTAHPGEKQVCRFVKRMDGTLRRMLFHYDPECNALFDARAKGLLPVWDLDKQKARLINLDGVHIVGGRSPILT